MRGLSGFLDLGIAGRYFRPVPVAVARELMFADTPLVTGPDDDPGDYGIDGRARPSEVRVSLGVAPDGRYLSAAESSVGEIVLENGDGGLDDLLATRVLVGRPLQVKIGEGRILAGGRRVERVNLRRFRAIHRATITAAEVRGPQVFLRIEPEAELLNKPVQTQIYAGSGGKEGPPELTGVSKPLLLGRRRNIEPTLVDEARQIWQVSSDLCDELEKVMAGGLEFAFAGDYPTYAALEAVDTPTSEEDTDLGEGSELPFGHYAQTLGEEGSYFRLANQPIGRVTCDARGYGVTRVDQAHVFLDGTTFADLVWVGRPGPAYLGTASGLILHLLRERAGVARSRVDEAAIAAADPDELDLGLWLEAGDERTFKESVSALAQSVAGFFFQDRNARFTMRRLRSPRNATSWDLEIDDSMIEGRVEVFDPAYGRPWNRIKVGFDRNHAVMKGQEVLPGVKPSVRTFLAREYAYSVVEDEDLRALFPGYQTLVYETLLNQLADARKVATILTTFYRRGMSRYVVTVSGAFGQVELGDLVRVRSAQAGLEGGKVMFVTGREEDMVGRHVRLELFG